MPPEDGDEFRHQKIVRSQPCKVVVFLLFAAACAVLTARASGSPAGGCRVERVRFDGWSAEQIANAFVTLTFVPQLGGRLMQITFDGHSFLFVNPRYKGQRLPLSRRQWFNYGGDKDWPMPEGDRDESHWAGPVSGPLDDGVYDLSAVSQGGRCGVRMIGPPDPVTGLEYSRDVSLTGGSPEISFHAVMKNVTGYPIRWSIQSVTQYDLSDTRHPADYNHDFWAYTPVNPRSAYLKHFHVRDGLAGDPSFSVEGGLFSLRWLYLQSEVWIDSPGGWLAAVDGSNGYAMVERFHFVPGAEYPGKATVIFYKNGPSLSLDGNGLAKLTPANPQDLPYYMEAEINSPVVTLDPGQTYAFNTEWFPTRVGPGFSGVTYAGTVGMRLSARAEAGGVRLAGTFGVFFPGHLVVRLFDKDGGDLGAVPAGTVTPTEPVQLTQVIPVPPGVERVSLHLIDQSGIDRGPLGEAMVAPPAPGSVPR